MEQTPQILVHGRPVTANNNPIFGDRQPASMYVQGIHHVHGEYEKLEFIVFDADGQPVFSGNEKIEGEGYSNWDKNNADYPYEYVCAKRGLTLVTE